MNLELFSQKDPENRISGLNIFKEAFYTYCQIFLCDIFFNIFYYKTRTLKLHLSKTEIPDILGRTTMQTYKVATRGRQNHSSLENLSVIKIVYELAVFSKVLTPSHWIYTFHMVSYLGLLEVRIAQWIPFTLSPEHVQVSVITATR